MFSTAAATSSDETRDLVSRVIRENGYTANRSARGLSAGRTGFVGVVVPLVYPAYFSGILDGAAEALFERDLQIVLSPTRQEHDREVSVLDRLHGMTDGSLIILPEESSEELERHLDNGFRFVVIDPLMRLDERIPSVSAANTSGADQAMRHLLDLGHRRIAQIAGPRGWLATEDRRRGYRAALAAAGILPDPALEVESIPEVDPGRDAAAALLALPDPPTAIFAFNDDTAIGAIQAARARGLRVPEDLSVVGFDDVEHATIVTPALTTVRQPLAGDGANGGESLEPAARAAELRGDARRARHSTRRPRLDGPAEAGLSEHDPMADGFGCRRCYGEDPRAPGRTTRRARGRAGARGRLALPRPAAPVRRVRPAVRLDLQRGVTEGGDDAQRREIVPVSADETEALSNLDFSSFADLGGCRRHLVTEWPTNASEPAIEWVTGELRLPRSRLARSARRRSSAGRALHS